MLEIRVEKLAKRFGPRKVFSDISFILKPGDSLAVTGPNGSGKTTLLRIMAGLVRPTDGKARIFDGGKILDSSATRRRLSYVGPELALYDALTARENLGFFSIMRGSALDRERTSSILDTLQLGDRCNDCYGSFSSGMKQRLKYAVALLSDPDILLLDEPTANLDQQGKELVEKIIAHHKEKGIVVIATNEMGEYGLAESRLHLDG